MMLLNVVVTVSRPMFSKSMVLDMSRAYKADKVIREDFTNPEVGRFEVVVRWDFACGRQWATDVDDSERQALLYGVHDNLVAGNLGFNKAYELL